MMTSVITTILRYSVIGLILLATPSYAKSQPQTTSSKKLLRVALFPYIPDSLNDKYKAMLTRIEHEFEKENRLIDLELRPIDQSDDFYDMSTLTNWLTSDHEHGGYDIVEVDTLLLGDLIASATISAWPKAPGAADWHPAARSVVTINKTIYGVPHWLCGHFIFTRNDRISRARSVRQLLSALDSANPNIPNLTGNLLGSWNLPALYLDAWADTNGPQRLESAITSSLDPNVMKWFSLFSKECVNGGKNPCIDGTFEDNDLSAKEFALSKSDAFIGYSERLNYLIQNGVDRKIIKISSAPLGEGKRPILFVDAFLLRKNCDSSCADAAARFASYMNSPKTLAWLLMSRDSKQKAVPRYLLPATLSAFAAPGVREDIHFNTLKREIAAAAGYPVNTFPGERKKMRDAILEQLKK
jgi:thiamine pyridinylase